METRPPASLRAALRRLPLGTQRVLEPACGRARYLRHFGPGSRGLDHSSVVVHETNRELARSGKDLLVLAADLEADGWGSAVQNLPPFDAVFLCDVVMHLAAPDKFLRELAELVAPGTPIISVEWTLPHGSVPAALARRLPGAAAVFETDEHQRTYRSDELVELFRLAGFLIEDTWIHSFESRPASGLLCSLVSPFWPVRTRLFRSPL